MILDAPSDPRERERVIKESRRVWREVYGVSRTGATDRLDTGCKRKALSAEGDEGRFAFGMKFARKAFTTARRSAADRVAHSVSVDSGTAKIDALMASDLAGWTAKHDKERVFQESKRDHRLREAAAMGHLENPGDDLLALAASQQANERQLAQAAARRRARQEKAIEPGRCLDS